MSQIIHSSEIIQTPSEYNNFLARLLLRQTFLSFLLSNRKGFFLDMPIHCCLQRCELELELELEKIGASSSSY